MRGAPSFLENDRVPGEGCAHDGSPFQGQSELADEVFDAHQRRPFAVLYARGGDGDGRFTIQFVHVPVRLEAAIQKPLEGGMGPPEVRRRGDDHGVRLHDRPEHSQIIILMGAIPGEAPVARLAGTDLLIDEAHHR